MNDLVEASKSIGTLQAMVERDVKANTVKKGGSHTRNLLRVKRGIDMVKVLFEQILVTEYVYLYQQLLHIVFFWWIHIYIYIYYLCSLEVFQSKLHTSKYNFDNQLVQLGGGFWSVRAS